MPELGGGTFEMSGFGSYLYRNGSQTVFSAEAHLDSSPTPTPGMWIASDDGKLQTLALRGSLLTQSPRAVGIDSSSRVGILSNRHLYLATPGNVQPITFGGSVYGDMAFYTSEGSFVLVDYPSRAHLWRLNSSNTLSLLAQAGEQAPGLADGTKLAHIDRFMPSRTANNVVFNAALIDPSGTTDAYPMSTFVTIEGHRRLLSRPGLPAPGLGPDILFKSFGAAAVNDLGQVILTSDLQGPGITSANDAAAWYDPGDGVLRLLLRQGDPFTFDGETHTVSAYYFRFITSGGSGADDFNNAGQWVARISFLDGSSGVFLIQIPEPASSCMAAALLLSASLVRRTRRSYCCASMRLT